MPTAGLRVNGDMDNKRDIRHTVRDFLFSSVNKEFLTFLFFLALAGIFWLMMALNETYEKEIEMPIRIVNIPKNVVLTSDDTDTIKVTIQDKGLVIIGYLYGDGVSPIEIDFNAYTQGNGYSTVTSTELQRLAYRQLSATTKIVGSKPDKLEIFYNYGLSKRVPVKWTGSVSPEHPYFISQVGYFPDSVTIYASQERLDSIKEIYTEQLSYTDFRDTLTVECKLQKIKGVKTVPDIIKIAFSTDVLTEESISDIPIKGINVPTGKVIRTFPSKVTVNFVTGVSRFRGLKADDFTVVVDYNEIARKPSDKCNIHLITVPSGISRPSLNVEQVDYLIEEE